MSLSLFSECVALEAKSVRVLCTSSIHEYCVHTKVFRWYAYALHVRICTHRLNHGSIAAIDIVEIPAPFQ
jgi:hypothetical protein